MKKLIIIFITGTTLMALNACKKSYNCTCTNKSGAVVLTIKYSKTKKKNAEVDCSTYGPFKTNDSTATCRLQ